MVRRDSKLMLVYLEIMYDLDEKILWQIFPIYDDYYMSTYKNVR